MRQKIIAGMTTPERKERNGFPAALRAIEGEAGVGSVTESDCAAAFGEWRVALVRVFSDLFLLHCLFGFEEAGNDSGKIAGFCSLLMVRYASGGAAAPWGAFERLGDLARKPVQRGIVAV